MTERSDNETPTNTKNAFAFWKHARDKFLTQPKESPNRPEKSNIDKNYEELTQTRGATEGAIQSKVSRWEDWDKYTKDDNKFKYMGPRSHSQSHIVVPHYKSSPEIDSPSPSIGYSADSKKVTPSRDFLKAHDAEMTKLEMRRRSRKEERLRLLENQTTPAIPPVIRESNTSSSSDEKNKSPTEQLSPNAARRRRTTPKDIEILDTNNSKTNNSNNSNNSTNSSKDHSKSSSSPSKGKPGKSGKRSTSKDSNNKKLEDRRKRIAEMKQKLRDREKQEIIKLNTVEVDKDKLAQVAQNWRKNKETKNSREDISNNVSTEKGPTPLYRTSTPSPHIIITLPPSKSNLVDSCDLLKKTQTEEVAPKEEEAEEAEEDDDDDTDPLDKAKAGILKNSISIVDLKMEGLDDDTVASLLASLLENTSVTSLLLDGNEMEAKSFMQLNELLLKTTKINTISLNFVMLGELGSQTIAKGLADNLSVTNLSVLGNDLFENGMASLGDGLKLNKKLTTLNLSENSISDAGCKSLWDIMRINSTITKLDISNNYINKEGAQYLAEMIKENKALKSLNLERNSMEDGGCEVFASALPYNNSLEELFLGNNIIETQGMLALSQALMKNNSLRLVDLQSNIFDIDSEIALQDVMLKKKGKLTILWKPPPAKNDPPMGKGDVQTIIDHFGAEMIVDIYKNNQLLKPLVDIELVITQIRYNQPEAQVIWGIVFSQKNNGYHHELDVLIRIVKNQAADPSPSREFCKLFDQYVDELSQRIKYHPADTKLQFSKLQVFQLIKYLVKMDDPLVVSALGRSTILSSLCELFFKFSYHSIFLNEFVEFMDHILMSVSPSTHTLLCNLLITCGYLERLSVTFIDQSHLPIPKRSGHFGHMTKIVNKIQEASPKNKKLEKILSGNAAWTEVIPILAAVNSVNTTPADLKPSESMLKQKKPPGEFGGGEPLDDSLV